MNRLASSPPPAPPRHDRLDACLWFVGCAALLFFLPIGFVSNDGFWHSRGFASGSWSWNPNHLLFEPLGAVWQALWEKLDPARAGVDALKLLAGLAGAIAVGLFRLRVVAQVTRRRGVANSATAWVALSSAFLRLWVSDEIHMIQMPFVVALAGEALRLLDRPGWRAGLRAGAAGGLATLCFVSNGLIGGALVLTLLSRRAPAGRGAAERGAARAAAGGLLLAMFCVVAPPLLVAAAHAAPAGGLAWLTHGRLGADQPVSRGESGYGIEPSFRGVGVALMRAGYGAASALVDLRPLAAAVRDRRPPSAPAVASGAAFVAALVVLLAGLRRCLRPGAPAELAAIARLTFVWVVPVLGFGALWSNSDDQFYFQLAPLFGLLAASSLDASGDPRPLPRRRIWMALGAAALAWNLADVSVQRILYPRAERIALLVQATADACLVIVPGFDEAELLLALAALPPLPATPSSPELLAVTTLATRWPAADGVPRLLARVRGCTESGRTVVTIDLFGVPLDANPWKYLRRLGYDHAELLRALEPLMQGGRETRVGPFVVRATR